MKIAILNLTINVLIGFITTNHMASNVKMLIIVKVNIINQEENFIYGVKIR